MANYSDFKSAALIVDGAVVTADVADSAVTTSKINDGAVTVAKTSFGSSTAALNLPSGTTAQRPSGTAGASRYNTDTGSIEFYNGSTWVSTNLIPTVNSVSGTIYAGTTSSLTLSLSNATETVTVRFTEGGIVVKDVTNVSVSAGSASVTVPSEVYGQTSGDTIAVSVINQDGTPSSNAVNKTVAALPTGGTITTSGSYRIHTFTSSSSLVVPSGFSATADYLVIAGGGGGAGRHGGGGGAGGYRCSVTGESSGGGVSAETKLNLSSGSYTVIIGAGGAGGVGSTGYGSQGQASSLTSISSTGGGGGANDGDSYAYTGGGSGGGASYDGSGGSPVSGQGYRGGNGYYSAPWCGSGGGGAGGVGVDANSSGAGNGGVGVASSITGSSVYRAGGGGGGSHESGVAGTGGNGGGGNGGAAGGNNGSPGVSNTGGGGGGASISTTGGNGGSGIVIVRYAL